MSRVILIFVCLVHFIFYFNDAKAEPSYIWSIPTDVPLPKVPADNPMTQAKVSLGEKLFFDRALSFNQSLSCSSCHQPEYAFSDHKVAARGATGQLLRRNTQALVNVAYANHLTWANSALTRIEQQILIPLFSESPIELGVTGHEKAILGRFMDKSYLELFERAFADKQVSFERIVNALASYVRSLVSFDSDFDDYLLTGNEDALTLKQKRGLALFFSQRFACSQCHRGINFNAEQSSNNALTLGAFQNTGLSDLNTEKGAANSDQGLFEQTFRQKDRGAFRVPTLRNLMFTAPYMHDGSLSTLEQVIDFYAAGGRGMAAMSPTKSPLISGFKMSKNEKEALVAFLLSLSDKNFSAKITKTSD